MLKTLLFFIFILLTSVIFAQGIDYKGFPQWKWGKRDSTEYYLYTPDTMEKGKRYPVVLVLHGCCGEDYHATLRTTVDPLVRVWHRFGANKQTIPTYIVAPKTKQGWKQHFANLKAVLGDLIQNHQGDPQRIYITGFSMGSSGTWQMLEMYPDYFAAAMPMGMNYTGSAPEKIKHIPIWTFRGEQDWWARHLGKHIADIRQRNGWPADSAEWHEGINPRITTFANMGHGIMWAAVSSYDLPAWAFSKVNDGNAYPQIRFKSPAFGEIVKSSDRITFEADAVDSDGTISKVVFNHNGKPFKTVTKSPFRITVRVTNGDNVISATAFDNKGKSVSASTLVRVDVPPKLIQTALPIAITGRMYAHQLTGLGNGKVTMSADPHNSVIPPGLSIKPSGLIRGIPTRAGVYQLILRLQDEYGDQRKEQLTLTVKEKSRDDVVITEAKTISGKTLPVTIASPGELPFSERGDTEITLSSVPKRYRGLPLIQTPFQDSASVGTNYLSFVVDEPVTVIVAYEKLDNLMTSTIPGWLRDFRKETDEQIVAQYFYYDIFTKDYPAGTIVLPGADAKRHGVNTNYFVMIKKKSQQP